jgi:hypothetical protein
LPWQSRTRAAHLVDTRHGAELRELAEELAALHRLERSWLRSCVVNQLEELRLAELSDGPDVSRWRASPRFVSVSVSIVLVI